MSSFFFFFNDTATTEIYTLSLHDALPISYHLRPPYACHYYMHGAGRYGLQCLTNLDKLPPTGAALFAAPLKIPQPSGGPRRGPAPVREECPPAAGFRRRRVRHTRRPTPPRRTRIS